METKGFSLIEVVVVLGILTILMVSVGGVMTSSFRVKNSSQISETVQNEAQTTMEVLKKNILDADMDQFTCPTAVGTSISFTTKSGGTTTLWCDEVASKIASISAQSGSFRLTNNGVSVRNCSNFVACQLNSGQKVATVDFSLEVGMTGGASGDQFWTFESKVSPR